MVNAICYYYELKNNKSFCIQKDDYVELCDNDCIHFMMTAASPAFLNHMDSLYRNASKVKKIAGFEDFVMHSTPLYFVNKNADGNDIPVSVEEVAEAIKAFYKGKVPNLRLLCCSAGRLDDNDGTAQKLANILNIKILAATGIVGIDFFGNIEVIDPLTKRTLDNSECWKVFTPNKEEKYENKCI